MLRELADEGAVEQPAQEAASRRHPAPRRARRHHRARPRRRTDRRSDRMGRGGARRRRRKSASHVPRKARPGEVAGVGDRALLRVEETGERRRRDPPHRPRHQDHRPRQAARARHLPRAAGRRRAAGADRQEAARPRARDPAGRDRATRRTAIWSRSRSRRRGRLRPADRAREGAARLAQERARGEPDRDPRPRHPACVSAARRWRRRRRRSPPRLAGREDWRKVPLVTIDPADAKDHDDAVHAEPDTDPNNPRRLRRHASRSPTSPITCGPAPRSTARRSMRGNSVYFPDRVVPMLPERISNDLCSLRPERGSRRARGAHGDRRRRAQALAHASIAC